MASFDKASPDASDDPGVVPKVASSSAAALHMEGMDRLQQRDYDGAVEALARSLEINPTHARTHWALGAAYHARSQHAVAIECYRDAVRHAPTFADAHWDLGVALGEQVGAGARGAEDDEAKACLREALRLDPHFLTSRHPRFKETPHILLIPDSADDAAAAFAAAVTVQGGDGSDGGASAASADGGATH